MVDNKLNVYKSMSKCSVFYMSENLKTQNISNSYSQSVAGLNDKLL